MEGVVVAAEVEGTLTDVVAVNVSRTGLHDESLTLTFLRVHAGIVVPLDHQTALVLPPRLGHHPLVANASQVGTETGVADRLAALYLQTGTGSRGDVVLITVIELDPFPAVIHRAHVLPEETDGDGDPFLPAVHPVHLLPGTGAEKTLIQDLVLGRVGLMIGAPDGEDLRLTLHELIRKNQPLILQRPARTVTITA